MNRRHSVGAVRPDDAEVRHPNLLRWLFLDQAHAREPGIVAGEFRAHLVEEAAVDFKNNLELARQEHFEP
jgi:hypothetical protein